MNFDDIANIPAALCVRCKGNKLLCGKNSCPIVTKYYASANLILDTRSISGSSPPSIFVGSFGYPKVRIGPAVPPVTGNTEIFERPDKWVGLKIEEISRMRFSLYRGYKLIPVKEAVSPGNYLSEVHDLLLSSRPVESSMLYSSPEKKLDISPETQPFGPGGYIRSFDHESSSSNSTIERMYYDTDIKASESVLLLYDSTSLYTIEKMLSAGMLGKEKGRRIVPTRWAITATDTIISNGIFSELKGAETVEANLFYHYRNIGNEYYILISPGPYSFEVIESWNNGSIWTGARGSSTEGDYEDWKRFVREPKIGGSFFAAKLVILDHLKRKGKIGRIIVTRFIDGEYTIPLGVWQVRENIRKALQHEVVLEDIERYFSIVKERKALDVRQFSRTYRMIKNQTKLAEYGV